jgi:hypothetical protein
MSLAALCSPVASAQGTTRASAAEQLFDDGRALIAEHRYREACEKLASSQKLDPAVGTLLSLGDCNVGQGKTASAWLAYRRAIALASERGDPRSAAASERAAAIEPQLSRLVLRVGDDARSRDVRIAVNGEALEPEVLREPVPVDPGPTTVTVSARGFRTWTTRVSIGTAADRVEVLIPPLDPLPDRTEVDRQRGRASTRRTAGLVTGGAGLAAAGVGAILGLQAIVKIREANQLCPGANVCANGGAVSENATGKTFADASTVLLPVGAVLAGAGVWLYAGATARRAPEVSADVGPGGARMRVGWSW